MANTIITHITDSGTQVETGPDAKEYLERLRGAIQTKRTPFIREVVRKLQVSSDHELRRLKWGI
jgi:hypothetical protein